MVFATKPRLPVWNGFRRAAATNATPDHEEILRARVLDVGAIAAAILALAHALLTQIEVSGWTESRIAGVAAAFFFALCPLLRRLTSGVALAGTVFLTTLLAVSAFAALRNGGLTAPTTAFVILVPAMAGLMLGGRAAIIAGLASLGVLGLLATADEIGLARSSPHTEADLEVLRLSAIAISVITATIVVTAFQVVLRQTILALSVANTELAASESTIKRKAEELDLIFNNVPVHLFFKDDRNRILRANKTAASSVGRPVDALVGAPTEELFPELAAKYFADDLAVIESGAPRLGIIEEIAPASGRRGWVRTDKVPYVDPSTGKRYVFVAAIDITEQRKAELALAESEQRFALAAQGSGAGIWDWVDVAGDRHFWAGRFFALLGFAPEEIAPSMTALRALLHPADTAGFDAAMQAHLSSAAPFQRDLRLRHKALGFRWYRMTGQAIWNDKGEARRMIGSIIDIDAEKCAEEALIARQRALERSIQDLKAFSQAVSHDLRSPLRAFDHLAGWVEEELAAGSIDGAKSHLVMMRVRVKRMTELLDGLRLYAQAGTRAEIAQTVSSRRLVEHSFEVLAPPLFTLTVASDLPEFETAAAPLSQVFRNLFDNAIKHHDRHAGVVAVRHFDSGDFWAFEVSDDGPGIPAAYHHRIFEMFEVLHRRNEQAGAGAGLAIVKKCVEAAGGTVAVSSGAPLERGSTFRFLWPKRWPGDSDARRETENAADHRADGSRAA